MKWKTKYSNVGTVLKIYSKKFRRRGKIDTITSMYITVYFPGLVQALMSLHIVLLSLQIVLVSLQIVLLSLQIVLVSLQINLYITWVRFRLFSCLQINLYMTWVRFRLFSCLSRLIYTLHESGLDCSPVSPD